MFSHLIKNHITQDNVDTPKIPVSKHHRRAKSPLPKEEKAAKWDKKSRGAAQLEAEYAEEVRLLEEGQKVRSE